MDSIKIGIIGAGGIARLHIKGYENCEGVKIAALADPIEERANSYPGAAGYLDYRDMLEKEKLDGVSICTPPAFHKEITVAALANGIHVLCEKPLALTAEEAEEMVNAADEAGKLLIPAFCHRFHEPVMIARELIQEGKLGRPVMFRNRFGGKLDFSGAWFSKKELSGGGCIIDTSVHSIDLFRYLIGEPRELSCAISTFDKRLEVEDCSVIVMRTEDGVIGTIEASWATPGSMNIIEIYCSEGAAIVDYSSGQLRYMTASSGQWQVPTLSKPDRFVLQAQHFVDCMRGKRSPMVTGEDGLEAARIIDAAYYSAGSVECGGN